MARVRDILAGKPGPTHTIPLTATVYEAIQRMVEHNVGALVVTDDEGIAGIFTERDHLRRVTVPERPPRATPVREVMTSKLYYVEPETEVGVCMSLMTRERLRHLPVLEGKALVGMISIGDLVKHVADERALEVRHLTGYITGDRA